jgi:hypothetical protein
MLRWGVLDTTLCNKVCQRLEAGCGFLRVFRFPPPIKLTATIITEILLRVALKLKTEALLHINRIKSKTEALLHINGIKLKALQSFILSHWCAVMLQSLILSHWCAVMLQPLILSHWCAVMLQPLILSYKDWSITAHQ